MSGLYDAPARDWDLVALELSVRIDPTNGTVVGRAVHHANPLAGPSTVLRLHQRALTIELVRVDGRDEPRWRVDGEILEVPVAPGQPHAVEIRWHTTPEEGLHFRGGPGAPPGEEVQVWSQGEPDEHRAWFPCWDHPSDRFTVATTVEVPAGLDVWANGERASDTPLPGGWHAVRWTLDRPIPTYLLAILVGRFEVHPLGTSPVSIELLVPPGTPEERLGALSVTREALPFFAELAGTPYPWGSGLRAATPARFRYTGMENAGLIFLSDQTLGRIGANLGFDELVVAHEVAHQWFGDLVTARGWRELWLNEGLAHWATARWVEGAHGPDTSAALLRDWAEQSRTRPELALAPRRGATDHGGAEGLVYTRGAVVMHSLEVWLGRAVLDAGIRAYVARWGDDFADTEDLRRALEDASGRDLRPWFDTFVHGAGVPTVTSRWAWSAGELTVTLDSSTASLPIELEIEGHPGWSTRLLDAGTTTITVTLDRPPAWVAADPRGGARLVAWTHEQPTEAWLAQLGSSSAFARLDAVAALAASGDDRGTRALAERLTAPTSSAGLRRAVARALATTGSPLAVRALESLARSPDRGERILACRGLGTLTLGAARDGRATLERLAGDREEPEVAAEALLAQASLDPARARADARRRLSATDTAPVLRAAAAEVLGAVGDGGDLARLLPWLDEARAPSDVLAAALGAVVARGSAEQGERRRRAAEAVVPLLGSRDLDVRLAAVGALVALGDPLAEGPLRELAGTTRAPTLREAAERAAAGFGGSP